MESPAQRTPEWHEARLGRVTGSQVSRVFAYYKPTKAQIAAGIEPDEKAERKSYREGIVAERLTGLPADPEPYVSHDMKWGEANEGLAKNLYQLTTKTLIEEAPFVTHPNPKVMAGASPDGFIGEDGVVEIKCLRSANHLYKVMMTQEIPEEYHDQMDMEIWVTGRKWCEFIAYDSRLPDGLQIFVQRYPRDEERMKRLEAGVMKFLEECDNDFKHFWAMVKGNKEDRK